jgi:AraC-like DNA-binding protein
VGLRAVNEFTFRLSRFPADSTTPTHHHSDPFFCYVARGALVERGGTGGEVVFAPGSVHFHAAGDPHTASAGPLGLLSLSIVPSGELADRLKAAFTPAPIQWLPEASAPWGAKCYQLFRDDMGDPILLAKAALELTSLLLARSRRSVAGAPPGWLDAVREYMERSFAEPLRLRDLAARSGVHEVHLIRRFRHHWGTTPGRYLLRLRVQAARAALTDPARSIADIAAELGFSSQAHLTDRFQRELGLPPAAWRRRLQAMQAG